MSLNLHAGSTLQCDTKLWDHYIEFARWQQPHVILYKSATFYLNRTTISRKKSAEKNDVMSIFKMADLGHLDFRGSNNGFFEKPGTTSYRSSIDNIALLSF